MCLQLSLFFFPLQYQGTFVSMGVYSDGSYNVPAGLIYSFPVTCANGEWKIVQGKIRSFNRILNFEGELFSKHTIDTFELDECI